MAKAMIGTDEALLKGLVGAWLKRAIESLRREMGPFWKGYEVDAVSTTRKFFSLVRENLDLLEREMAEDYRRKMEKKAIKEG